MRFLTAMLLTVSTSFGALAADVPVLEPIGQPVMTPQSPSPSFFSEIRLGVFGHGIDGAPEKGQFDVNGEILFAKPFTATDPWIDALLPRPHIGASVNTGKGTSMAYTGLTWTLPVTDFVFVEASLGAALNNGIAGAAAGVPADRIAVGCNLLFRESASLGFQLTQNWSVMGTIEHSSNAGACVMNRGITNAGVRFGYKF